MRACLGAVLLICDMLNLVCVILVLKIFAVEIHGKSMHTFKYFYTHFTRFDKQQNNKRIVIINIPSDYPFCGE